VSPMHDIIHLLHRAGFRGRLGADPETIARVEAAFGVTLTDDLRDLWTYSDGLAGDGIEILSLAGAEPYAGVFFGGFGYVPFTDCNDSNPYAVCCQEPLRWLVVHAFHDEEARLICRGVRRFLELVAETRAGGGDVDRIEGDFAFDRPERTAIDVTAARALVRVAEGLDRYDRWRGDALRFAAQLFGPGQENELANLLAVGDEYTREAVLRRWAGLGTPAAQTCLRDDRVAYRAFLAELRRAAEAGGVATEPDGPHEFRLQPGSIGLNFAMLFADRHRPGALAEWVGRFREWTRGQTSP
jgi:hypothetical protein